jgi:8-oxo-dGTP pyrophosphatase MutT (NUDIX family)
MPQAFQSYKPRFMKVYGAICVNGKGEVLLVHGRRSKKWSFPKGHCQDGETDLQCALRELKEETGLQLEQKHSSYHKLRGGGYFIFAMDDEVQVKTQDHWEVDKVAWWPLTSLPTLDSNVDVSIFRTLMKSMKGEPGDALEFLESPQAKKKMNTIKHCIDCSTPTAPTTT